MTKFGQFSHNEIAGKRFGSQLRIKNSGFVFLLHPSAELWSSALRHRTQIIYSPDISFICSRLNIKVRCSVLEAGTGSGSVTHALSRLIGPDGNLYSFEYHNLRFDESFREFKAHGIIKETGGNVTLLNEDILKFCRKTSLYRDTLFKSLDAILLDMPNPWLLIPLVTSQNFIKNSCRICCFLPCIEQVQRTIFALKENHWHELELHEVEYKQHEARKKETSNVQDSVARIRSVMQSRRKTPAKDLNFENSFQNSTESVDNTKKHKEEVSYKQSDMNNMSNSDENYALDRYRRMRKRLIHGEEVDSNHWRDITKVEFKIKSHTSYLLFASK